MGVPIDGKKVAMDYRKNLKEFIKKRVDKGLEPPCIASILVGSDKGSLFYIKNQSKICSEMGVEFKSIILNENIAEEEVLKTIDNLNKDKNTHGIILQLPLPKKFNGEKIINRIYYKKDVDGLTDINSGKFYKGEKCFIPCTAQGIIELIKSTGIKICGKKAVVLGRSTIVGKPVAQLLVNEDATVTICHSKTENLEKICKEADILVSAVGKPKVVTLDMVKKGAVVIDVGFSVENGKMVGDVDYYNVLGKVSFITPVPGGVGSMTPTMLVKNTCEVLKGCI
ncbi:tetrahydrofolate dehydrogenase/cyclohydrolase catalytic domain-containing protein [Clostridium rectalis]|uniref:tetrahydrofolate dehydrogenase/cyclohydrolase catalytic domain-containing protein n=1 Tax=Clostridium rectalis TaxID=2040295 RepID=UPI000F638F76|nr:tetrahydrofolate dehydrogenase/cyclohydrolase catalytic domain-containing protein [Clostridium rectalis]